MKKYSEYFAADKIPKQIANKFPDSVMKDNKMKEPEKGSGDLSKIRSKPGESNAFKKRPGPFAGPDKTFPMANINQARNALARAHFAKNPSAIREKVHSEYSQLAKNANQKKK